MEETEEVIVEQQERKDSISQQIVDRRQSFLEGVRKQSMVAPPRTTGFELPFQAKNLTQHQVEKLKALFEKYYDVDKDGVLTERDIESLNEKFVDFTGWSREEPKMVTLLNYHKDLFECMLAEVNKDVLCEQHKATSIPLNEWMKMWDRIMKGSLALMHLPGWVQVMPFNLFTYIDKKGRGYLTKEDLLYFYTDFVGLDDKSAGHVADNAWVQMTGNGDYKLTLDLYTMSFSNFLFGRTYYGPGLFILGTFRECLEGVPFKFALPNAAAAADTEL